MAITKEGIKILSKFLFRFPLYFFFVSHRKKVKIMDEKITNVTLEDELQLEEEYKQMAENILQKTYEKALTDGQTNDTKIGIRLIDHVLKDVSNTIKTEIFTRNYNKGGVMPKHQPVINDLLNMFNGEDEKDRLYNLLTLITMNNLVSAALSPAYKTRSRVVSDITREIQAELKAWYFNSNSCKRISTYFNYGLSKRSTQKHKIIFANKIYLQDDKKEVLDDYIAPNNKLLSRVSDLCIEYAILSSGYFKCEEDNTEKVKGKPSGRLVIKPEEWLLKTWMKNIDILTNMSYKYCPTLIKPKSWSSITNGGYHGILGTEAHFLRLDWDMKNSFMSVYKKRLERLDLSYLFSVVNALQNTPFSINDKILDIALKIRNGNGGLGSIDTTEPMPKMPRLINPTEKEKRQYKHKITLMNAAERTRQSHLLRLSITLAAAKKYSKYEKIYFPWNMDYRGRLYPIPTEFNPQGDDIQKALLLFAEPKAVEDEQALELFYIEGANRAGIDKVTFKERIQWVLDHEQQIIKSTENSLEHTFWSDQDEPFQFLAWSFEFVKLRRYQQEHNGSIIGFKTGIPINYDGTCSGLQHFSMLLHDEVGGQAVNLVPQDYVSDIYSIVADKVNEMLHEDAINGTEDGVKTNKKDGSVIKNTDGTDLIRWGTKTMSMWWIMYGRIKCNKEGINRKVCKRSVMTLAYGSGRYGFAENIKEDILKPFSFETFDNPVFLSTRQAANYMASLIWKAVKITVTKAVEGMEYLQQVAKIITKDKNVVQWVTPNGLLVQQNKYKDKVEIVNMFICGRRHKLYVKDVPTDIDDRGQIQAVAPNFIHSLDATHMQRVIHKMAVDNDKTNLFMIHDSFGTDLASASYLFKTIRNELVELYDGKNYLEKFINDVKFLIDDTSDLPSIPEFGSLDIKKIKDSMYSFA